MKKKILSLLLAVVMLFSMIPLTVITALAEGEPTVVSELYISGAVAPVAGKNAVDNLEAEWIYPYAPGLCGAVEIDWGSWYQGEITSLDIDEPTPFTGDFVAGEKYCLVLAIVTLDGYIYDETLDISAFGADSVIYKRFDEYGVLIALNFTAVEPKAEAITAVDVQMPPIGEGDVIKGAYYPLTTDNENVMAHLYIYQSSVEYGEFVDPTEAYYLSFILEAKDAYVFDEPTVTVNGVEYAVDYKYFESTVPNAYYVEVYIIPPITITGIPAPVVGQTVDQWGNSITEEPFMSGPVTWAGAPVWLEGEFDDYNDAMLELYEGAGPFTGTFQDNQHYTLCNFVNSKEEGSIPASATVIAAGTSKATYESLEKYESEGAMIYLTYTFGTPAEKELISSVNITMPEVAAGTAPTAADVTIDGATCTVKEMEWISPVSYEDTYTILENDKVYRLCLELATADGYKFSGKNPPAFTINGKKVEIDYEFTGQSAYYAEILFRLGTPTPYCIDFRVNSGASGEYFWEFGSVDYVLPECPYTHSTKVFGGWEIDDVIYQPGDIIQLTKDVSAYPVWEDPASFTVSFDKNGGSGSMADVSVIEGQSYTLPSCTFSAPSYKQFRCWSVDGVEKQVGDKITVNKDTTVKALWVYTTPATAVTLTDNLGGQTVLTEDATGTGYTYDAETATLTLNNWSGRQIQANGNFDLHLKGTNTITMADGEGDNTYGIYTNYKNVSITADEGGTLNINGRDLTKYAYGMYGYYYFYNGTVNIDINAPANCIRGIMGSMYINDSNKAANLNIRVENTKEGYNVYALQNGSFKIKDCTGDVNVNVEAYATKTGVARACISTLTIQNCAPKVTFKADNDGGDIDDRAAFDSNLDSIRLNAGGKVTFDGPVRNSGYDMSYGINRNTVTTTPANNEFMWHKVNSYWTVTDLSGNTLEKVVFEYSETPTTLVYRGNGLVSIPSMKVDDGTLNGNGKDFIYIDAYIIGSSGLGNLSYKLASGSSLPAGLNIASGGYIYGKPTTPCAEGTAEIIVTDDNGTRYDTSDDQTVTVSLPYGRITSAKPVTAITLNKDTIILDKSGTDTLTATLTPLDVTYPDVRLDYGTGITVTASEAVNGVITLNVKAGDKAGKYTVSVVSLDTGVHKEFNVYVKESTPSITLDADDNLLRGFSNGYNYKITAEGVEDYTFTAVGSTVELKPEWVGKTLNIIRVNAEANCNSDPQILSITTKTVTVTKGTGSGDYIVGDIVTVTADEAPVGYQFAGWSGAEGLTFKNSTDAGDATIKFEMPNKDVTLTATYEIKKFTVAFNNSGYGTGTMDSQTVEYGDYVLPNCTFTPNKGYKFQHWRIGYGATANPGDTIQITSDVTIYAIFEYDRDTEFNITVNNGTAKIASTPVTKASQFNRITITASGVDGKVFSHWETTSEGVTFGNANSESTYFDMPYNDVVVTAVYVDPHTHVGVKQDGKDATCTTDGWKDYYKCSCDALYADEACTIEITDLEAWKIGEGKIAAGHIYGDLKPAQEAIHTATVLKGAVDAHYFCDECDTYFDSNKNATTLDALTGDAPSHSGGTATCNAKAKCSTCGASYGEVNKSKHSALTTLKAVSATCSKTGLTEGKKCTACGVVTVAQKTVAKKAHTYKSVTTKATTSKNGSVVKKCSVCGSQASKTTIYYAKKIKLSTTKYTYNGKAKKPTVTVYDSKGKKISSSNYEVTYKDNKKVGKATVTVKFKGSKYSGSLKTTFTINPKKTTVSKLTAAKKSLKVKITKQSSQVTGYEIQYSTSKKFTKSTTKTKKVTSYKTTSVTLKSLKAKKTYYVRVRTYKTVNGKKYYSDWSSYKSKKTK